MAAKFFIFHRLPTQEEVRELFKRNKISAFCTHASFESQSEVKVLEEEENRAIRKHARMHLIRLTPDPYDVRPILAQHSVPYRCLGGLVEPVYGEMNQRLQDESSLFEKAHDYYLEGKSENVLKIMRGLIDFNARLSIEGSKALARQAEQLSKSHEKSNFALVLDPAFENVLPKLREHSLVQVVVGNPKQDFFNEQVRKRVSGEKISGDGLMRAGLWNVFSNYLAVFNLNEVDSERLAYLCLKKVTPIQARKICEGLAKSRNKQFDFVSSLKKKQVFLPTSRQEALSFLYKNQAAT